MMAIEKDRERRYSSAVHLGDDLKRFLKKKPVLARPPGITYRTYKFVRRNKSLVAATCSVMLALAVGMATSIWFAVNAYQANQKLSDTIGELERTNLDLKQQKQETSDTQVKLGQKSRENQQLSQENVWRRDASELDDLLKKEQGLWPVHSRQIGPLEEWLQHANSLVKRLPDHQMALDRLQSGRSGPSAAAESNPGTFVLQAIRDLVKGIGGLEETIVRVARRRELAAISKESIKKYGKEWNQSIGAIRETYGLEIKPQEGLKPLGPDPQSKLMEFAHLLSGEPPERDGKGALKIEHRRCGGRAMTPGR